MHGHLELFSNCKYMWLISEYYEQPGVAPVSLISLQLKSSQCYHQLNQTRTQHSNFGTFQTEPLISRWCDSLHYVNEHSARKHTKNLEIRHP